MAVVQLETLPDQFVSFKYQGVDYEINLSKELAFDSSSLDYELSTHERKLAPLKYYYEELVYETERAKQKLDVFRSEAWKAVKLPSPDSDTKPPTDKLADAMVDTTPEVMQATEIYLRIRFQQNKFKRIVGSFDDKLSAMQTLSANNRSQMKQI